jgi:arabinose-5-phosphate isomerase
LIWFHIKSYNFAPSNDLLTKTDCLRTIDLESQSISGLSQYINEDFEKAVNAITNCKGRVVISGIGKSAVIAQKIVATLNSTGTPSIFMHAADAIHGDLGIVQQDDVVLIISKSGESPEIKVLVPLIKNFKTFLLDGRKYRVLFSQPMLISY